MTDKALDLLGRMAAAYGACTTYRDEGAVRSVNRRSEREYALNFTTSFIRPDHFRFEYAVTSEEKRDHRVIWMDGGKVRSWWSLEPETRTPESLGMAVASATGTSSGAAHQVSSMLVPEIGGNSIHELSGPELLADEELDGTACHVVEGTGTSGFVGTVRLHIGVEDIMIRKVFQEIRLTREEHQKKLEETVGKIKQMKALRPQEEERHSKMIMLHLEMIRKTKGLWVVTELIYRPERNIKIELGEFRFQPPV